MLVTFESKASGDVIMFGDVAHRMMAIMGKEEDGQGIVTVEQLPEAIARLKAAVAVDKQEKRTQEDQFEVAPDGSDRGNPRPFVSLSQRAMPLIELLERSLQKRVPVLWGA